MVRNAMLLVLFGGLICTAKEPWTRHVIDDSSRGADGVRLADFNSDGRLDVVTGWEQGGVTRVYIQPSLASLHDRWPAVTVGKTPSVEDAVAVDLDGDGHLDVVSSTEGKSRTLFVHWSPAKTEDLLDASKWKTDVFPDSVGSQAWMFCLPMQVDGQRGVDLVTGSKNPNGALGWWQSPEDPRDLASWKYFALHRTNWVMCIFAEDVDRDGRDDIVFNDRKGNTRGVKWLRHPGYHDTESSSGWKVSLIGLNDKESMFGAIADLNEDGWNDLVFTTWNGTIECLRRLPGTNVPQWEAKAFPFPFGYQRGKSLVVRDFDRDGRLDIVTTMRSQPVDAPAVALLKHHDDPFHGPWKATDIGGPEGSKFDLVEAVDLDRDGDLDLITCEEVANLGVFWYENPTY